jgi:hypothetical protein
MCAPPVLPPRHGNLQRSRSFRIIQRKLLLPLSLGAFLSYLEEFRMLKVLYLCSPLLANTVTWVLPTRIRTLLLSSFALKSSRDSKTSVPLQSLCTQSAISFELLNYLDLKEINHSSFLLQMDNSDAVLAIPCSRNLLLSAQGVQQPCDDPTVDSSSIIELDRVIFLSMPTCTLSQFPPIKGSRILR